MQTQQNMRGSPQLPAEYQIQCPSPVSDEWRKLMAKAAPKSDIRVSGIPNAWYRIKDDQWDATTIMWPNTPVIPYEEWKAALTGETLNPFKEGDWVIHKSGMHPIVAKCVERVTSDMCYYDTVNGMWSDRLRYATPEEIAKASGKVDEWKVGDVINLQQIQSMVWYKGCQGMKNDPGGWLKEQTIVEVDNGWACIDQRFDYWLPPKSQCAPLSTKQPKSTPISGSNVGRRVEDWLCTSEDGVDVYDKDIVHWIAGSKGERWTYLYALVMCKENLHCIRDGQHKVFSTEQAALQWVSENNQTIINNQTTKTKSNAKTEQKIRPATSNIRGHAKGVNGPESNESEITPAKSKRSLKGIEGIY